ncbi:MAG TPA: hypothetical protein VJG32_08005 [Anaerolineae bacterium]|nr:hypothetical protein [Anaerolineae bacterium]
MGRRRVRAGFRTQPPREATLILAVVLWLLGFASLILGALPLPSNLGVWALVLSGLLLIIGSLVDAI